MSMVEINQFNLNTALLTKYKSTIFNNTHWHKIIVENVEGLVRDMVLRTIMKFCHPLHFIPVCYKSTRNTATFLMKNCGPALERMFNEKLIIPNDYDKNKPFKISIQLCFANANDFKINIQDNVLTVLHKKFNGDTGILDLSNFGKNTELDEYCPLSQPKLLFYILHLAKDIPFNSLVLTSNDIESLKPLEALYEMKTLRLLDLRHNNIKSISELNTLKKLELTELWLNENPLCDNFDEYAYVTTIKELLPTVQKLDNVNINEKLGYLTHRTIFLCSQSGLDLVDQFLEHYFTLYDAQNRSILTGIYHKDALFSLTYTFLPSQSTSLNAEMSIYKKYSRNLLHLNDFCRKKAFLFSGSYQILKALTSLPPTEHDTFNCTIDLIMHTQKTSIIVVTGIFREVSDNLLEADRLLSFTRTFVLLAGKSNEYSIVNDMIHISNATTSQANQAFKQIKVPNERYIYIPKPHTEKDMNELAVALKAITGLNLEWSHKCLEECKYDLKKAITLFVNLYKIDKLPGSAFDSSANENTNIIKSKENSEKTDIKAVLNESHQYGKVEQFNKQSMPPPARPMTNIRQAVSNIERNQVKRTPVPTSTPGPQPMRTSQQVPRPAVPPMTNMTQIPHPEQFPRHAVPPSTNIRQIPHPLMGNIRSIVPSFGNMTPFPIQNQQNANNKVSKSNNKQKYIPRVSLVNIQLNK